MTTSSGPKINLFFRSILLILQMYLLTIIFIKKIQNHKIMRKCFCVILVYIHFRRNSAVFTFHFTVCQANITIEILEILLEYGSLKLQFFLLLTVFGIIILRTFIRRILFLRIFHLHVLFSKNGFLETFSGTHFSNILCVPVHNNFNISLY